MKHLLALTFLTTMSISMTGCAPGAAVAATSIASGFAIKANTADKLSKQAEQNLIYKVTNEVKKELQEKDF